MDFFLYQIGVKAPFILFFLTIFLIINKINYLKFFVVGWLLNSISNILLKLIFKEPRPDNHEKYIRIATHNMFHINFDKYGMPSGHSQSCGFMIAFIFLVLSNYYITTFYLIISLISILQRYLYKNHTMIQLFTGFMIGIGFGYITYLTASNYIKGNIKMKKDESAPI